MKDYSEQIEQLRKEITGAIIGLLRTHGLTEIVFPDPLAAADAPDSVFVFSSTMTGSLLSARWRR